MRFLLAGVAVLSIVGLGTLLIVAACVGLGTGVARLLPLTLFQASLLCLFSLVTLIVLATRIVETVATLARAADATTEPGLADDASPIEEDIPSPATSTTLMAVTTEVFKVSALRPRQKDTGKPRPHLSAEPKV